MNRGDITNNKSLISFIFLIIPLFYYGISMSRTIGYVDSSLVLSNAYDLVISAWVDNHNLFSLIVFLLMKTFRGTDPFIVSNVFSMVCGALTVFFTFLLTNEISKNYFIAGAVSIVLMLSHSLTWHSTMLEVYTLNTFLMMVLLYCFYMYYSNKNIRFAYLGAFVWGLGVSNHILMGLFVFPFISFLIIDHKSITFKRIIVGVGCFLGGFSLFIFAFIKSTIRYNSILKAISLFTGGDFRSLMFSTDELFFWTTNYLYFFLYQFSIIAIIIGIIGFKSFFNKNHFSIFFLISFFVQLIWSLNYHVWDIFAFALPVYVMFTLPIAACLSSIRKQSIRVVILSILILSSLGQVVIYHNIDRVKFIREYISGYPMIERVGKTFNPVKYFLNPSKKEFKQVEQYVERLFSKLPDNAVLYDNIYDYPISYYYQSIKKERLDIYCPIIFAFWVLPQDIERWSKEINTRLENQGREVYVSPFVFTALEKKLEYRKKYKIIINKDEFLYRLEY